MKVVRLFFNYGDNDYFLDKIYEEGKDDQTNCDNTLKFITDAMTEKRTIAVMMGTVESAKPSLINLSLVPSIVILNVAVYDVVKEAKNE
jgi:hypothetical protein